MKKVTLLIVFLACLFVFGPKPAHADDVYLETWCIAEGENWDPVTSRCTVNGSVEVNDRLLLGTGGTIIINNYIRINGDGSIEGSHSIIYNRGVIDNYGLIWHYIGNSQLYNYGTISNYDRISNSDGTINNYGRINNEGTISNARTFFRHNTINNYGIIYNGSDGIISNIHYLIDNDDITYNINNFGTIQNDGLIDNGYYGIIYNHCRAIYDGAPPDGHPVVYRDYCVYLPLGFKKA